MTIEEFTEIVKLADKKAIENELKRRLFTCCNKHKKLGKVGIVPLIQAVKHETEDFADAERKHLFNGRICGTVEGFENYEFLYVNIFDIKPSADPFDDEAIMQTEMGIWAKKTL